MKKIVILCFIFLLSFNANAEEKSSKVEVEKLMNLTEVSKMIDAMQGQIGNLFNSMSTQMNISEKEKPAFNKYMKKVELLLQKEMNWNAIKEPMIQIYTKHLTKKEVNGLINFYQSDVGRSMIKKMPLIVRDSMLISQDLMKDFLPKVQTLAIEMQKEIHESREKVTK